MKSRPALLSALWFAAGVVTAFGVDAAMRPGVAQAPAVAPAEAVAVAPAKSKAELAAAKATYDQLDNRFKARQLPDGEIDSLYLWSLRWAEADSTVGKHHNAYADHLDRMTRLSGHVRKASAAGILRNEAVTAMAYSVAEAKRLAGEK